MNDLVNSGGNTIVVMNPICGWLIRGAAVWGIRRIYKLWSRRVRERFEKQVEIIIRGETHNLLQGEPDKRIEFHARLFNPTPVDMTIKNGTVDILWKTIQIFTYKTENPVKISRGSTGNFVIAIYKPFLSPYKLPESNDNWRLQGELTIACYFGDIKKPIPEEPLTVHSDKNWSELKIEIDAQRESIG